MDRVRWYRLDVHSALLRELLRIQSERPRDHEYLTLNDFVGFAAVCGRGTIPTVRSVLFTKLIITTNLRRRRFYLLLAAWFHNIARDTTTICGVTNVSA